MKLRNKKTGEIREFDKLGGFTLSDDYPNHYLSDKTYHSLAELNEEWEDYEEPKEHWAIDQFGEPINVSGLSRFQLEKLHRLGNDFPSKNATMKAIEKLNAWQRLEDKGFRFRWIDKEDGNIKYAFYADLSIKPGEINRFDYEDLDLLFGGDK